MSDYLIKGGHVVDPANSMDEVTDIAISEGMIEFIGSVGKRDGYETIDASGLIVAPGFVDMHTHLREPGREDEETIASGSAAAAAGGYTAVCAMPNTDPVADSASVVEQVWAAGKQAGLVDVIPAGALTMGSNGEHMAALGEMATGPAQVRLFTDDGRGLQSALMARRCMEYLKGFDAIYAEHCEDATLASGGHMHEGERSARMGLRGIPAAAEELMAARDISLARLTGCRLHLLHISTARTVALVREAKAEGLAVTAEATPHHFALTDEAIEGYDPLAKVNPPLRTDADREAIISGLADGTIDAIATDHAPHAPHEKDCELTLAPPGLVGLETALGLTIGALVAPGHISMIRAIELLSAAPARILGLDAHGNLAIRSPANLVLIDPVVKWTVDPSSFASRSRNTPFTGHELTGRAKMTFFNGAVTARDGAPATVNA